MKYNKRLAVPLPLLAILILNFTGCKKCEEKELNVSVMTYNVAGLPEGISSSHPLLYSSSISPLLNGYNIVHMQEDFCYHDSILLSNTHPYRTETLGCVPGGDGLNTLSAFPISGLYREAWINCTGFDCYTPKGFSYSQITLLGEKIDFYNVHCNAGSSDASKTARRGNLAQICNYIALHSTDNAVIIMGDFNSRYTREGDTIRAFLDMGFKDVWVELIHSGTVPDISSSSLSDCDSVRTNANCERIDKMFYRSNSKIEITPTSYQLDDARFYYQGNDTLQLSDHWPASAKFNFKKK